MNTFKTIISLSILLFFSLHFNSTDVNAQSIPDMDLDIQANDILTNAHIIELVTFAFDQTGSGSRLLNFTISNNENERVEALYLDLRIISDRRGPILDVIHDIGSPFSMNPGQTVFGSNNSLSQGRINGIDEQIFLEGDLTSEGETFFNSLRGRSTLPVDEYVIILEIYQGGNRFNGTLVARSSVRIGTNLVDESLSIYLQSPGDIAGTDISITNSYPEFRWEGIPGQTYRVIVVEEQEGETAETLIQSARSTSPAPLGQSTSLLEFENADVLVEGNSFQFPSSGVQPLREGKRYYWQVATSLLTTSGEDERFSEIWSFKLDSGVATPDNWIEIDGDIEQILIALLGRQQVEELLAGNFRLESLELDGIELEGESAREELLGLIEKIQDGKIKIAN